MINKEQRERLEELKREALIDLPEGGLTVPKFCEKLEITDEILMMRVIAELEIEGKLQITEFDKGYNPDGCAFYLAKYGPK